MKIYISEHNKNVLCVKAVSNLTLINYEAVFVYVLSLLSLALSHLRTVFWYVRVNVCESGTDRVDA